MDDKERKYQDPCSYSADYRKMYVNNSPLKGKIEGIKVSTRCNKHIDEEEVKSEDNIDYIVSDDRRFSNKKRFGRINKIRNSKLIAKSERLVISSLILIFCVSILGTLTKFFGMSQPIEKLHYYDDLIWPVVMQDPQPFDEGCPIDKDKAVCAAIWNVASKRHLESSDFDNQGRIIIPAVEVENSIMDLFGKSIDIGNITNKEGEFYKYDKAQDKFYVEAISGEQSFYPRTTDFVIKDDKVILNVEYITPQDKFGMDYQEDSVPKAEKYMQYIIKKSPDNKQDYICEVCSIVP